MKDKSIEESVGVETEKTFQLAVDLVRCLPQKGESKLSILDLTNFRHASPNDLMILFDVGIFCSI